MPQIIYTDEFISDFDRIYMFLNEKNSVAAKALANLLQEKLELLISIPKAFVSFGEYKMYLLQFGSSGYAILYDYDESAGTIILLRIKHQKEAGFTNMNFLNQEK